MNFAVLLLQASPLAVWARDASLRKLKEDPEGLAGLEEIPLSCDENVNLYIAIKCFIIPSAINKFEHHINKNKICYIWGEGTLRDCVNVVLQCFVYSPRYDVIWPNIYI